MPWQFPSFLAGERRTDRPNANGGPNELSAISAEKRAAGPIVRLRPTAARAATCVRLQPERSAASHRQRAISRHRRPGRSPRRRRWVARYRPAVSRLPRGHRTQLDLDDLAASLGDGYGHVELVYDLGGGGDGDGWLHALFRYRHHASGHAAETSFGAHVFNTILTYRDEPQSYSGRPPGLSTTLFLRLGDGEYDTLCHLIYPASRPWRRWRCVRK